MSKTILSVLVLILSALGLEKIADQLDRNTRDSVELGSNDTGGGNSRGGIRRIDS